MTEDPSRPPHRVRDLDREGRIVAAVVGLLLLVPVGASVGRALDAGWVPSNDDAHIVLRAFDVFSDDAPLVGQPSTSEHYVEGHKARHPGPIEFYLLAVPVRVLGSTLGTLLTAAAFAGGAVLITAWVAFRRAGPAVALGASVGLALAMWSSGTAVLSDPISSNVGGYPLIAGAALAWAVWCGDRRLWPLAVALWSFTIQQHLAVFGIAGLVAAWGVAGAAVTTLLARHREGTLRRALRWGAASAAVGLVCWLPPLIDQLTGSGNLGRILSFSGEGRDTVGLDDGLRAAGRAIAVPPLITSREATAEPLGGWKLIGGLDTADRIGIAVGAVLLVASVVLTVLQVRRRDPGATSHRGARARLALAATAVVVLVAGIVTVANVPASIESSRINFYRWMWTACLASWGVIAWTIGDLVARRLSIQRAGSDAGTTAVGRRSPLLGVAATLLVVAIIVTGAALGDGYGDTRRDEAVFAFEAEAIDATVDALPRDEPVLVHVEGTSSILAVGPALVLGLVEAGFDVRVTADQVDGYGDHRVEPPPAGASEVWVRSGNDDLGDGEGTKVAAVDLTGGDSSWNDHLIEVRVRPGG